MRTLITQGLLTILRAAQGPEVWTVPPENAAPPYTVIGKITDDPVGGKGSRAAWFTVEINDWTIGETRVPLDDRMDITRTALRDVRIAVPGLAPFTPELLPAAEDDILEDGVTWAGTQRFRILGQRG